MRLAKLIVEVRPAEPPELLRTGMAVARALGAPSEEAKKTIEIIPRYVTRIPHDGVVFGYDASRAGIDVNWPIDEERAAVFAVAYLDKVKPLFKFDALTRFGVRTVWLKPTEGTFDELVSAIRERWFKSNELLERAHDISLPMTFSDSGNRVNVNIGPIHASELPIWGLEESPAEWFSEPCFLADVDYARQGTLKFGPLAKLDVVKEAIAYGRRAADTAEGLTFGARGEAAP